MTNGRSDEAEKAFHKFLADIQERPWIKKLIFLSWGMFTPDIEAMTWNNLGVISMEQGRLEEAKEALEKVVLMDPECPLPYNNLAIIAAAKGDETEAKALFEKSQKLGYTRSSFDQMIHHSGELLARVEGGERD